MWEKTVTTTTVPQSKLRGSKELRKGSLFQNSHWHIFLLVCFKTNTNYLGVEGLQLFVAIPQIMTTIEQHTFFVAKGEIC